MKSNSHKILVIYFGIVQSAHLIVLLRAAIILAVSGRLVFPAAPPPEGWTIQAQHCLLGNGLIDALNIAASLLFIGAYLKRRPWQRPLGLIALTAQLYSALLFGIVTIQSGAWMTHPVGYFSLAILYLPIFILTVRFYSDSLASK